MQEIISTIGGALVAFITSLVEALRTGFTEMFWEGTGEARTITDIGVFLLVIFGLTIAVGASKLIYGLIKNR